MELTKRVSHAATVLPTEDIDRSILFYSDKLGFEVTFTWQEPVDYAVLKLGGVSIHLTRTDQSRPTLHTAIYIFVEGINELHEEYTKNGVEFSNPIGNREYGMRDFDVKDPEGNVIGFGENL